MCLIEVSDTGPGLSDEALANLFKPFLGSTRRGGSGLGLVNVREIARAHGGDARLLRSDSGGAVFQFSVPCPHYVAAQQTAG